MVCAYSVLELKLVDAEKRYNTLEWVLEQNVMTDADAAADDDTHQKYYKHEYGDKSTDDNGPKPSNKRKR
jgi:hypothetical protein